LNPGTLVQGIEANAQAINLTRCVAFENNRMQLPFVQSLKRQGIGGIKSTPI
jgi:hypothetical protein